MHTIHTPTHTHAKIFLPFFPMCKKQSEWNPICSTFYKDTTNWQLECDCEWEWGLRIWMWMFRVIVVPPHQSVDWWPAEVSLSCCMHHKHGKCAIINVYNLYSACFLFLFPLLRHLPQLFCCFGSGACWENGQSRRFANENNLSSKAATPTCEQVVTILRLPLNLPATCPAPKQPLGWLWLPTINSIYEQQLSSHKKGCTIAGNCICAGTNQIRSVVLRQDMTLKAHQQGQGHGKRSVTANVGHPKRKLLL